MENRPLFRFASLPEPPADCPCSDVCLCDLSVSNESMSFRDEWAVKYVLYFVLLLISTVLSLEFP